jgi:hypothetical protein
MSDHHGVLNGLPAVAELRWMITVSGLAVEPVMRSTIVTCFTVLLTVVIVAQALFGT